MSRILVVDDEPRIAEMLGHALASAGHEVDTALGGREALRKLSERGYAVVITDVVMDDVDGFAVLEEARTAAGPPDVIIITGFGTIDSAVDAIKQGATDYIPKPLDVPGLVERVSQIVQSHEQNHVQEQEEGDFGGMIGRSPAMCRLYQLIEQIGPTDSTVMIYGKSGTGKELAARAIHQTSGRRDGPFVPVDCGALTETLLQSELFGHVKGAFTGAAADKIGLIEAANGGTLFLDEVAQMTPATQQKLLRCLQERTVRSVGSTEVRGIDVRVVSATNHRLDELVGAGRFREDLYYRLNVVPLHIPPLSERRENIPLLAEHFARKHARRFRRRSPAISDAAATLLANADWPGNIRQLENAIECAVTFADGPEIGPEHLAPEFVNSVDLANVADEAMHAAEDTRPSEVTPLGTAIRYLERQMLQKALDASNGNKELAAGMLEIDRATLYRKLKNHRL